jgi:hypothetical protein
MTDKKQDRNIGTEISRTPASNPYFSVLIFLSDPSSSSGPSFESFGAFGVSFQDERVSPTGTKENLNRSKQREQSFFWGVTCAGWLSPEWEEEQAERSGQNNGVPQGDVVLNG